MTEPTGGCGACSLWSLQLVEAAARDHKRTSSRLTYEGPAQPPASPSATLRPDKGEPPPMSPSEELSTIGGMLGEERRGLSGESIGEGTLGSWSENPPGEALRPLFSAERLD